jgi:hypothetical protein
MTREIGNVMGFWDGKFAVLAVGAVPAFTT